MSRSRSPCGRARLLCAAALTVLCACDASEPPTFTGEVAAIVHRECAGCHHKGGVGPFELIDYEQVRSHAGEIASVVANRYMPPWLPRTTTVPLAGARRLDDEQIDTIVRWVEAGAPRGAGEPPPPPVYPGGWQLESPDRILTMPDAYTLKAEGTDEYRNFVIRSPVDRTIWVGAFEFDPGNLRVVHHARILIDPSASSRRRDDAEPEPGFGGMSPGDAIPPDGMILGWAPGKVPGRQESTVWRIDPGTDVVLQLHMIPSGKPEAVQARLAIHEVDGPPANPAFSILLGTREIDIPAGATDYTLEDRYVLPVDVEAVGLYPHAHYLGKTMRLTAERPDGSSLDLLEIDDWDFNWQDDYWFEDPVSLPAGTALTLRFSYDNSAENIRNPSLPPRRVVYGPRSVDEMAEMLIQVVPRSPEDRSRLELDHRLFQVRSALAWRESERIREPKNPETLAAIATNYVHLGEYSKALTFMRLALHEKDDDADMRANFGWIYERMGNADAAADHYRIALTIDDRHVEALTNLGRILRDRPEFLGQAVGLHQRLVELRPDEAEARVLLADTLRRAGRLDRALTAYLQAIEMHPEHARALSGCAWLLATHPSPDRRDAARALTMASSSVELSEGVATFPWAVLAAAQAEGGDFSAAQQSIGRAIEAAGDGGREELIRQRALYRANRTFEPRSP